MASSLLHLVGPVNTTLHQVLVPVQVICESLRSQPQSLKSVTIASTALSFTEVQASFLVKHHIFPIFLLYLLTIIWLEEASTNYATAWILCCTLLPKYIVYYSLV